MMLKNVAFGCAAFLACFLGAQEKPVVGVYVGRGAFGVGPARWLQLAASSGDLEVVGLDASDVTAKGLSRCALVILPDGAAAQQAEALGANAQANLKAYLEQGGALIASAAGARLVVQGPQGLGLVPWKVAPEPRRNPTQLSTSFTARAKDFLGVGKGNRRVWYTGGPVLVPGEPVAGAAVESIATFKGDINPCASPEFPPMTGSSCCLAGTFGKGRLVVFADSPEYNAQTFDIVRGALGYALGRAVQVASPQRRRGDLSVGFYCDEPAGLGRAGAVAFLSLLASHVADVEIIDNGRIEEGLLRHLDLLVVPPRATLADSAQLREFKARGGLLVEQAQALGAIKTAAEDRFRPEERVVRTAIYADWGVSCAECWNASKLISFSPRYAVTFVDRYDIAQNVVNTNDFDLLLMCGGPIGVQEKVVGPEGRAAVTNFVRQGGAYYGICAGTFSCLQAVTEKHPRFALVPFKNMPDQPYRGWCEMDMRWTADGEKALGFKADSLRQILYWGGPVMVPASVPADCDIRVFATYAGQVVNTFAGGRITPMAGSAAITGGRFGKGKVVGCAIHPECSEGTRDVVKAILKYLTGVAAEPAYPTHRRGAIKVAFCMETATKAGMAFGMSLVKDPRFDVRPVTPYEVNQGLLDHIDVLFFPWPEPRGYMGLVHTFLKRGGRAIELDPEGKGTAKGPNIFHVKTFDEAHALMLNP